METISLLDIGYRDISMLRNKIKTVRLSSFNTPSSFYVQLVEEDEQYDSLEAEMFDFYTVIPLYKQCHAITIASAYNNNEDIDKLNAKEIQINELKSKVMIAVLYDGRWQRCITESNPRYCRILDTGVIFELGKKYKANGVYELNPKFLKLPPRAILCGLGKVLPLSPKGFVWTTAACKIFLRVTRGSKTLRAYFMNEGLLPNSAYLFLTSVGAEGSTIHVNTMLCAWDEAIADNVGLHHPIWPNDVPC